MLTKVLFLKITGRLLQVNLPEHHQRVSRTFLQHVGRKNIKSFFFCIITLTFKETSWHENLAGRKEFIVRDNTP